LKPLSKKQRLYLKKLSHHLKPVIIVGHSGLGENVVNEIEIALERHELIKIKIMADKDDRREMTDSLCNQTKSELINQIGQMSIVFRVSSEKPQIALPSD
jgi:RNA-binding protein